VGSFAFADSVFDLKLDTKVGAEQYLSAGAPQPPSGPAPTGSHAKTNEWRMPGFAAGRYGGEAARPEADPLH
jgi:hypothetical protein